MGNMRFDSPITGPGGTPIATLTEVAFADMVAIGDCWQTEDHIYPAPAASPAPLTTDAGIQAGLPSPTTGLRFVPWSDLNAFNYQGNYMIPAGTALAAAAGVATTALGQNASTPRKYTFGSLNGEFQPGTINVRFATDSTRVIPVWFNYNAYHGTAYHDMHMMVSDRGVMKHLSDGTANNGQPRTSATGGGFYRRELTFLERRMRKLRAIMPGFGYFAGVWIDSLATITKTENKQLILHNMDSWNEPTGASFSDNPGGGFPSGSYQCLGMPEYSSFISGQAHGTVGQGGTGEANANGSSNTASNYAGTESSAAWSDSRVNDLIAKFGPQYPILTDIGGWNDGSALGTPYYDTYLARVTARYTKLFANSTAAGRDIKAVNVGIQPVDWVAGDGGFRDLSANAQAAVPALFPGKVLGHIPLGLMWSDRSTAGQRSLLCLSQSGIYIHLNMSGNLTVAQYIMSRLAKIRCQSSYLALQRSV